MSTIDTRSSEPIVRQSVAQATMNQPVQQIRLLGEVIADHLLDKLGKHIDQGIWVWKGIDRAMFPDAGMKRGADIAANLESNTLCSSNRFPPVPETTATSFDDFNTRVTEEAAQEAMRLGLAQLTGTATHGPLKINTEAEQQLKQVVERALREKGYEVVGWKVVMTGGTGPRGIVVQVAIVPEQQHLQQRLRAAAPTAGRTV